MFFYTLIIIVFILGYCAIALEHPIKIDKAASALITGALTWTILMMGGVEMGLETSKDHIDIIKNFKKIIDNL